MTAKGNVKLDEETVRAIRRAKEQGMSAKTIAQQLNVGLETIRRVLRGDTWAWVK